MERDAPSPLAVRPPQAVLFPSAEIATANIIPQGPSPIGGLKILTSLPGESSQSRTVLSWEPVTTNWFWASIPILIIRDVCIPISIWRKGSLDTPEEYALSDKIVTISAKQNRTLDQYAFFIALPHHLTLFS